MKEPRNGNPKLTPDSWGHRFLMRRNFITVVLLLSLLSPFFAAARDYTPQECPIVGNKNSGIYHGPGGRHYRQMLQKNKRGDNRACFLTEEAAKAAGYRKSKT